MHIPDGFISPPVAIVTSLASAGAVSLAMSHNRRNLGLQQAPIIGLTTAFIFAAQMINFPVAAGTSGHLLGGTLAAVVLGSPWAGMIALATVLLIQAFLFADGGITALGANIFNMAVLGVGLGWILTQTLQGLLGGSKLRLPLAAGISAGVSVVVAALACSLELALSGTSSLPMILPAMTGIHILIGVGEGIITGSVLTYLIKVRPEILTTEQPSLNKWLVPIVSILLMAGVLSLFASAWPDGLEKVATDYGFINLAENVRVSLPTPLADYQVSGWGSLGTSMAGIFGAFISFFSAFGIVRMIKPKSI